MKIAIEKEAKNRPVIVFGKTADKEFIDSVNVPLGVQKQIVTTEDHVKKARKYFLE